MLSKIKVKTVALVSLIAYILTCIPVIYVGFFNYATGDDYLYGAPVKHALEAHEGIGRILKIVIDDVIVEYNNFQATWASCFLWRFEPSIWGEKAYIITIFISMGILNLGGFYFIGVLLKKVLGLDAWSHIIATTWSLFYIIQFMIFPRGGLYWYTGMVQYTLAFGIALIGLGFAISFVISGLKRYIIGAVLIMAYLGGAGYPEIVISVLGLSYVILWGFLSADAARKKRSLLLLIPLMLELVGFAISAVAPGNAVRGGEDYGFSLGRVVEVFSRSFIDGTVGFFRYFIDVRPLILLPICMFVLGYTVKATTKIKLKHLMAAAFLGWFQVCMTRSPEIYAGSTVTAGFSGGVYDSYFYISVLYITFMSLLLGLFFGQSKKSTALSEKALGIMLIIMVAFWLILRPFCVGNMLDYTIYEYVSTGQLYDYDQQMQERFELFSDPNEQDVVVPYINDQQGPLMHMAINEDVDGYTNRVTAGFYGKRSVKAIERDLWNELYGNR